jgi:hypothetical protein
VFGSFSLEAGFSPEHPAAAAPSRSATIPALRQYLFMR